MMMLMMLVIMVMMVILATVLKILCFSNLACDHELWLTVFPETRTKVNQDVPGT